MTLPKPRRKRAAWNSFFRQTRIGKTGERLETMKLRTMRMDADEPGNIRPPRTVKAELYRDGKKDPRQNDWRVVPSKRFLRRFWIDELPQLKLLWTKKVRLFGPRLLTERDLRNMPKWFQEMYLETMGPALISLVNGLKTRPKNETELKQAYEVYFKNWKEKPLYTDFKLLVRFGWNWVLGRFRGA
ncbi:MAG: sugar transferase [Candidatus Diapherotrites archaeon]|uniref:Sugar transferase n=1 Tax=Candidatus Iainarchaeum sp. TaxID=3101447 RepID=A0A8T4L320_9ARCH|nr:sugar transferase [Candidatus Diapherotrites archaeon]